MSASAFLRRVTEVLGDADVDYMVTGSFASSFHGAPRTTQDLDLVVEVDRQSLLRLLDKLPDDTWYVSEDAAIDALRRRRQFNAIDLTSGWKADLIVRKERPFSRTEFERRQQAVLWGVPTWVATAEDVVVAKLEWAQRGGGSERQIRDAAGVVQTAGDRLDRIYIEHWVNALGLNAEWRLCREALG